MSENAYMPVKPSQVHVLEQVPFYYQGKDGEYVLYKESGKKLSRERVGENKHPALYIEAGDKEAALKELTAAINMDLARSIAEKGLKQVKQNLCSLLDEVLAPDQLETMDALPDTVKILMEGYEKDQKSFDMLRKMAAHSSVMAEHTINVLALTMQYGYFHQFDDKKIIRLSLCAMLHDVGVSKIDTGILESKDKLNGRQFENFKTHTTIGHDLLTVETDFDISLAEVALEHHERLDGSGYPNGITNLSSHSQLIGLIDCYEALTYREKSFRKAQKPFDTLSLIKEEVKQGKFNRELFIQFTSCLVR